MAHAMRSRIWLYCTIYEQKGYTCRRSDVFLVVITIVDDIFKPGVVGYERCPVLVREARVVVAVIVGGGGAGAGDLAFDSPPIATAVYRCH